MKESTMTDHEVRYSFRRSPWQMGHGVRLNLSLEVDGQPTGTWCAVTVSDDRLDGKRLTPAEFEDVVQEMPEKARGQARETVRRLHATYEKRAS